MSSSNPILDTNDPRLTAYVLGELAPTEAAEIEAALQSSPELRTAVADIRRATEAISNVFMTEPPLNLTPKQKSELLTEAEAVTNFDVHSTAANVTPAVTGEFYRPTSTSSASWLKIAIAAGLAGAMLGGAYYFSTIGRPTIASSDRPAVAAGSVASDKEAESKLIDESLKFGKDLENESDNLFADSLAIRSPEMLGVDSATASKAPIASEPKMPFDMPSKSAPRQASMQAKKFHGQSLALKGDELKEGDLDAALNAPPNSLDLNTEKAPDDADAMAKNAFPFAERDAAKHKPPPKLTPLELAQQSINQSALRSFNLKVIPQEFAKTAKQESDETVSPMIFKLQISDQDAKRIVGLLSQHVDPRQQRSLSFDDLIGFQKMPPIGDRDTTMDDDAPSNAADNPQPAIIASQTQQASVAMLAVELRKLTGQSPLHRSRNGEANKEVATANTRKLSGDRVLNETPDGTTAIPLPNNQPSVSSKSAIGNRVLPTENRPESDLFAGETADQQIHPNDFHFDYTQVIQQLKTNLELRNQSLLPSQR